jgi:hypothetical protein
MRKLVLFTRHVYAWIASSREGKEHHTLALAYLHTHFDDFLLSGRGIVLFGNTAECLCPVLKHLVGCRQGLQFLLKQGH